MKVKKKPQLGARIDVREILFFRIEFVRNGKTFAAAAATRCQYTASIGR